MDAALMTNQSTRVRYPRHVPDLSLIELRDRELIAGIDSALAESARRSGGWLVCRPGCTDCCMGAFDITELDARRLRRGLLELEVTEPERAGRIRERTVQWLARWSDEDDPAFDNVPADEPCPALDPLSGTCDLYAWRPVTCRVFGPPVTCGSNAVGVCELCYAGATADQIAACQVDGDPGGIEAALLIEIEAERSRMVVATALAS